MNRLRHLLAGTALAAALVAGAPVASQAEMVFHKGNGAEPETLDVHRSSGVPEAQIQLDLFEGLVTVAADGTEIPGAAESWSISDDGKTYTFKLRENGMWSDGSPMTAEDWVFSWRRLVDPATASDYAFMLDPVLNAKKIYGGEAPVDSLGIKAVDDHTIEVTLENPTPYFLSALTHHASYAISKANYEKFGEDYIKAGNLVSNGAYMLAEAVPQTHIKLVKNPHFHDAANVAVDTVFYYPTEDQDAEIRRYEAGELDVTYDAPSQQIPRLEAQYAEEFHSTPYFGTYYYAYNLTHEPWKDSPELRAALSLAIDRDILTKSVTQGGEVPAYTFVPPGTNNFADWTHEWATMTQADRDALAKELLEKSGAAASGPLKVQILYNTSENHKKVAIAIAAMWKEKLGIETEIQNEEWATFLDTRDKKLFLDIARQGWIGDYNDAQNFLVLLTTGVGEQNPSGYSNPEFDRLMDAAAVETDLAARAQILQDAEKLMMADNPVIPIYTYTTQHMVKPYVTGWVDNVNDQHPTRFISVAR